MDTSPNELIEQASCQINGCPDQGGNQPSNETPIATHPALSSHHKNWNKTAPSPMVFDASDVNGKQASSGGSFLINDNEGMQRSGIRTKRSIDITLCKPVTKKKGACGAKGVQVVKRGKGFSRGETESILELLREHLRLAKDECEKVYHLHELRYSQRRRNPLEENFLLSVAVFLPPRPCDTYRCAKGERITQRSDRVC